MKNIIEKDRKLYAPGTGIFFNETVIKHNGKSYHEWDARRSKFAAALAKGARIELKEETNVLYLGAAHGYTLSFLSVCTKGRLYSVEFAPRVARELILLAEKTNNILPIVADANKPELYYHLLEPVELVFQDIAQRNQVQIFLKNCNLFLKQGGIAVLALKARSIDVSQQPKKLYADVKRELEASLKVLDYRTLDPLQKDHAIFICRKK